MVEEYIKLLESFKKNQISDFIQKLNARVFETINSSYASHQITQYFDFKLDDTCTNAIETLIKKEKRRSPFAHFKLNSKNSSDAWKRIREIYADFKQGEEEQFRVLEKTLEKAGLSNKLNDRLKTLYNEFKKTSDLKKLKLQLAEEHLTSSISAQFEKICIDSKQTDDVFNKLKAELIAAHNRRLPFEDYALQPDNISQIKKLINALHYTHLTFLDLEKVDVRDLKRRIPDLYFLYKETIDKAYEASYLATHLDVDLRELFQEELSAVLPVLLQVQQFAKSSAASTTDALKEYPLSFKMGEITGVAADQMRPLGGDVDYNFLTQFSAELPGYIDQATQMIKDWSSQIKEKQPTLNKAKLDEIQNAALNLLNDIENLQGNSLFISLKFLNYIHIIRNIITLCMSSLEQVGELNESTQDFVRDKLAQLKYTLMPQLFGLVDKIEINAMAESGTLSDLLMEKIRGLYDALIYLPAKAIDFHAQGEELLSIEDSHFIELRLELAYKRIDAAHKTSYTLQKAQEGLSAFYEELKKAEYNGLCLHQLSAETKEKLKNHYKVIRPYMERHNLDLSDQIIYSLIGPETWASFLGTPFRWAKNQLPADHISIILEQYAPLQTLISKGEKSQLFHIQLNEDLINSVYQKADLALLAYKAKTNAYAINEALPLGVPHEEVKLKLEQNEFANLQDNFNLLIELIEKQIKPQDEVLNIDRLDSSSKEQCQKLYKKLHPYFTYLVAEEQKEEMLNLDQFLAHVLSNKTVETPPSIATFSALAEQGKDFFEEINAATKDVNHIHYDLEQKRFLTEEESNAFQKKEREKLRFTQSNGQILLENPEQLTAEQAIELRQYYRNRCKKVDIAGDAYLEFIALLSQPEINGNILKLGKLSPADKKKYRCLYNKFQPYFIDAMPEDKKTLVKKYDQYIVALLSDKPIDPKKAPHVKVFLGLDAYFQDALVKIKNNWKHKSDHYYGLAEEKFKHEQEKAELKPEKHDPRMHFLLKHTKYSKGIHEFRISLFSLVEHFNQSMQAELTPQTKGTPFPEMEDPNKQLTQSKQVRAIKDIYNSLYYLEGIVLELEKLNDKSLKSQYVTHLLFAYGHINEIIKLCQRLAKDPHYGFITQELIHKAQKLYAGFQEHSDAYQVSYDQVPLPGVVQYNPLWYVLNAFYISPKHIRALKNINYLTTEELDELHLGAKKATLIVEGLIQSSDSYFKLFLQTPNMVVLYQELSKKLNEFTTTTHDAVLSNLDKIRATILTPMQLEADRWEDKLGLTPGKLSEPLRRITDEYYKGLLHPLDLHSKWHIRLICDPAPLQKRTTSVKNQISNAEKSLVRIDEYYADVFKLHELMQKNKALVKKGNLDSPLFLAFKMDFQKAYKRARPKLTRLLLDKKIFIEPSSYDEDHLFDKLCLTKPQHTEIEALVTASYHYALGLQATHTMRLRIAEEKLTYLTNLRATQDEENLQFVEEYTTKAFAKHLKALCDDRHIGLQCVHLEYQEELKKYLLTFKKEIIKQSKTADDINLALINALKQKISRFEKDHYEEYYHLDSVRVALAQFRVYFSKANAAIENNSSIFENEETLKKKSAKINELEAIATGAQIGYDLELMTPNKKMKEKKIYIKFEEEDSSFFTYYIRKPDGDALSDTIAVKDIAHLNKMVRLSPEEPLSLEMLEHVKTNILQITSGREHTVRLSIKQRIEQIKPLVKDANFKRIILAHQYPNSLSFAYLKLCFVSLVEALHLYTPTRKKLLHDITDAVNNPPKINELTKRFGLFAKSESPEIATNTEENPLQAPIAPPTKI